MRSTGAGAVGRPNRRLLVEAGGVLLEALVGILIFTLGVLGIVGMQARAIGYMSDAQQRSEAANLANAHLARMWAERPSDLATRFANSGQPAFDAFKAAVFALPGAAAIPDNPRVTVVQPAVGEAMDGDAACSAAGLPSGCGLSLPAGGAIVTVTIRWMPGAVDIGSADIADQTGRVPHAHTVTAVLGSNV